MTRKRLLLAAILLGIGVAVAVAWPRGPRLEWYTSPPVNFRGETIRFQALVPAGWAQSPVIAVGPGASWAQVILAPAHSRSRVEEFLRRLFRIKAEEDANIEFLWGPGRKGQGLTVWWPAGHRKNGPTFTTTRQIGSGPVFHLTYTRANRAEYDATFRHVCESFQVIRQAQHSPPLPHAAG